MGALSIGRVLAQPPAADAKALEGLWSGSWGGGPAAGGGIMQPVLAEMVVRGDRIEAVGFRFANKLAGTVHVNAATGRLRILPANAPNKPAAKDIIVAFELKGDELTLIDEDQVSVSLHRVSVARDPLADVRVEFVTATGINEAGDLLVTHISALRTGQAGAAHHRAEPRRLNTQKAMVLLLEEKGSKKITLDEARRRLRESSPVVLAHRPEERRPLPSPGGLWDDVGPVMPDSEAAGRMFARLLRPGTLVFVLPAPGNVVQP
jgi:hypothetical protein